MAEFWGKLHHLISPESAYRDSLLAGRDTFDADHAIYYGEVSILADRIGGYRHLLERQGRSFTLRCRVRPDLPPGLTLRDFAVGDKDS